MKALVIAEKNAVPVIADLAEPVPGPGQVALRVAACGLNFADLLMCAGTYQDQPAFPLIPGMEIAGTVTAAGAGVDPSLIGRRVAVLYRPGRAGRGGARARRSSRGPARHHGYDRRCGDAGGLWNLASGAFAHRAACGRARLFWFSAPPVAWA
jgi:NADPH:quinone reductase-like Zn-dependent oxidoreductase